MPNVTLKSTESVRGDRELTYSSLNSASVIPKSLWPSTSDGYGLSGAGMNRCVSLNTSYCFLSPVVLGSDVAVVPRTSVSEFRGFMVVAGDGNTCAVRAGSVIRG